MGPIRDTLKDFLVYPHAATRRLMLELRPMLHARVRGTTDEVTVEEEGDDEDGDGDEEHDGEDADADEAAEEAGDDGVEDRQVKKTESG